MTDDRRIDKKAAKSSLLLFMTACIWGFAFVFQSQGMEVMGPFTFNGVRSLLGAAVVFPMVLFQLNRKKSEIAVFVEEENEKKVAVNGRMAVAGSIFCGIVYTAASTFQQIGIAHTTVGKAGFITAIYIVLVPVFGFIMGKKINGIIGLAAIMAMIGMYLLCMTESLQLTAGDTMVIIGAVLFAVHILVIDYLSQRIEGVVLSCVQLFTCGVICSVLALLFETPTWEQLQGGMVSILYAGIMSCGVAYTLQIIGQKGLNPTVASMILSLESVVATLAGYGAYKIGFLKNDQSLTLRQIAGCAVVFAAVLLAQYPQKTAKACKKE